MALETDDKCQRLDIPVVTFRAVWAEENEPNAMAEFSHTYYSRTGELDSEGRVVFILETKASILEAALSTAPKALIVGVADGTRTHDNRNHNPGANRLQTHGFMRFTQ